jgi:pimeloyl-ACP methyl ester carboxylesterase
MNDTSSLYLSPRGHAAMMAWYERMLSALPDGWESLWAATRYGKTHVLACGPRDGEPVVLLHGTEGSALSWRYQLADLGRAHRVYAVDIIGANGQSAPTRLPWSGQGYGEWLLDLLDALSIRTAAFAGISNGAWHIFKLAALAPQRISRAILLSAHGLVPVRPPFSIARFSVVNMLRMRVLARLTRRWMIARAVARAAPPGLVADEDEIEWLYLVSKHYRFRYPPERLREDELRALRAPTLLLMGRHDPFFDARAAVARAARALPDLRDAAVLESAGHALLTDQPKLVNGRILDFLARTGGAADKAELPARPPRSRRAQ